MDEFKTERDSIKNAPFKVKVKYFWDYYKWHVIVGILAIWLVGSLIHHYATYRPIGFHAVMINSSNLYPDETYADNFARYADINTEEYQVFFDTTMYLSSDYYDESTMATVQKIMVYFSAGDLDVMVCDYGNSAQYIYNLAFGDIRTILTEDQIQKLEPYFVYADPELILEIEADRESNDLQETYVYPSNEEAAAKPQAVPIGISLKDCAAFLDFFYPLGGEDVNLYVFQNTAHPEDCAEFIEFVCAEILK